MSQPTDPATPQTADSDAQTLALQLANQFINIANGRLEAGLPADIVAAALRHAAGNFSAFAAVTLDPKQLEDGAMVEEFAHMVAYYADVHAKAINKESAAGGLMGLVEQAKNEI